MTTQSKLLVESDPHRTRLALFEDGRLAEIFLERWDRESLVGNIYKGRVTRVLPGMQAAFVDLGLERDAFLYVSDAGDEVGDFDDGADEETEEPEPPLDTPAIADLVRSGQELVVQVKKDPLPNKGARITTQVTLPGRYLVFLPTVRHRGVSRRIEDEAERLRLRGILDELGEVGGGWIVRTAGEGRGREEFTADRDYLLSAWEAIRRRIDGASVPSPIHRDLGLALRVIRDVFHHAVGEVLVDGRQTYEEIVAFVAQVEPSLAPRVHAWSEDQPLFERYGVEEQLEAALESRVWLKSGGYLVINPTEALVAIDVNTGRYVGRDSLEETVVRTNLEAAKEIVRQIRLRDLGGILVIDFIDMEEEENRRRVFSALEAELRRDRAKNKVLNLSDFGLVELTRKRSRANLARLLTQPCPYCRGTGRIHSDAAICFDIRRQILSRGAQWERGRELHIEVHPAVARALNEEHHGMLEEIAETFGVTPVVRGDEGLHHERFHLFQT